jgi:hypothetical protein
MPETGSLEFSLPLAPPGAETTSAWLDEWKRRGEEAGMFLQ